MKFFLKILLALGSVVLALGVVNLFVRFFLLDSARPSHCTNIDPNELIESQTYLFKNDHFKPNSQVRHCDQDFNYTYTIDATGFRGLPDLSTNSEVLAIGDSFTFGYGVADKDTFPAIAKFYNAGEWARTYDAHVRALSHLIPILKPKTVVWSIYPPHLITLTKSGWGQACPGSLRYFSHSPNGLLPTLLKFPVELFNYISIGAYIKQRMHLASVVLDEHGLSINKSCYFGKEAILYDPQLAQNSLTNLPEVNQSIAKELEESYAQLQDLTMSAREILTKHQIRPLIVLIPSKAQLEMFDSQAKDQIKAWDYSFKRIRETFIKAGFNENQIVDLMPVFADKKARSELFFAHDAHWNGAGHKAVAAFIQQEIAKPAH